MSSRSGGNDRVSLELGGVVEEAVEFIKSPFKTDEYRVEHLKLLARIAEDNRTIRRILKNEFGTGFETEFVGEETPDADLRAQLQSGEDVMRQIDPEFAINASTEKWSNSGVRVNPTISNVSFNGDLLAGDEENVVVIESNDENVQLEIAKVGMTGHKGDIDNDNTDESIVRYLIQYKEEPGSQWKTMKGPTGVYPLGSLDNPSWIVDNSFVTGITGFRVRFENRTDESGLNNQRVGQDKMGARVTGRAIEEDRY